MKILLLFTRAGYWNKFHDSIKPKFLIQFDSFG